MCYVPADPDEVWASPILASGSNHVGNDDRLFHIRCQDLSGPCCCDCSLGETGRVRMHGFNQISSYELSNKLVEYKSKSSRARS